MMVDHENKLVDPKQDELANAFTAISEAAVASSLISLANMFDQKHGDMDDCWKKISEKYGNLCDAEDVVCVPRSRLMEVAKEYERMRTRMFNAECEAANLRAKYEMS